MAKAPRTKRIPDKAHQANVADRKSKKRKGHAPGSRHSEADQTKVRQNHGAKADPRLGSKKPVPLTAPSKSAKEPQKHFSPAKELSAIEQDPRLEALLDKAEQDQSLTAEEKTYIDQKLARHRQLCELLGIDAADDKDEKSSDPRQQSGRSHVADDEDALLDKFMNSDIKDLN
ncbi:Der GTPase-activating protein YihI [Lacimicrobium alkaliphilum]|uniref:Der GTPase-activating protein YihI n=1 Tax=Lacimicrobium alkaliphilum TaxID=1526571 RepID=A0A0U2ZPC0_9ALTE|nr:Der GTPase-activating protein YihI [Lacimicrobium alkaliphilum]ALT00141.1 hypothetical protein AT746_18965 [Lacimicrobium alkaliphilum]